jgi:hypothetical protein
MAVLPSVKPIDEHVPRPLPTSQMYGFRLVCMRLCACVHVLTLSWCPFAQRDASLSFSTVIADFQLLLFLSGLMPNELFKRLCAAIATPKEGSGVVVSRTARDEQRHCLEEAERWILEYAGLEGSF